LLLLVSLLPVMFLSRSRVAAQDTHLTIAAAADLQFAMGDLVHEYEKQNQTTVDVTYGSSGYFFSQIQNGAPFDLFFSADTEYPERLQSAGLVEPGTLYVYAIGQLVIWAPQGSTAQLNESWSVLIDPTTKKIAIANPKLAPYGRAAIASLQRAGIYQQVQSKLVYGENISQAAQFVESGSAQLGIIAKSLAVSPAMKLGESWPIPADMHAPIQQAVAILRNAKGKEQARKFLDFVKSNTARAILEKDGFTLPNS
jgi:molybdate transport system substrate-binding protein